MMGNFDACLLWTALDISSSVFPLKYTHPHPHSHQHTPHTSTLTHTTQAHSPTHTHSLIRHGIHPVILQETNSNSVFHIPSPSISLSPFFSQAQSFILTNTLTLITHAQAQAHAQAHAQTHKLALQWMRVKITQYCLNDGLLFYVFTPVKKLWHAARRYHDEFTADVTALSNSLSHSLKIHSKVRTKYRKIQ